MVADSTAIASTWQTYLEKKGQLFSTFFLRKKIDIHKPARDNSKNVI